MKTPNNLDNLTTFNNYDLLNQRKSSQLHKNCSLLNWSNLFQLIMNVIIEQYTHGCLAWNEIHKRTDSCN